MIHETKKVIGNIYLGQKEISNCNKYLSISQSSSAITRPFQTPTMFCFVQELTPFWKQWEQHLTYLAYLDNIWSITFNVTYSWILITDIINIMINCYNWSCLFVLHIGYSLLPIFHLLCIVLCMPSQRGSKPRPWARLGRWGGPQRGLREGLGGAPLMWGPGPK